MIYAETSQYVYCNAVRTASKQTTTFDFYESHFSQLTRYYRFQIQFYESLPRTVRHVDFQAIDSDGSGTIGLQGKSFLSNIILGILIDLFC